MKPWSRRDFVKQLITGTGAAILPSPLLFGNSLENDNSRLIILHTNDVHSRIEPFPAKDKRYGGQGGVERRYALIQKIRAENPNVLLVDSGDIFQGTPYFNFFKGELEMKLMTQMGYEAGTMGNHDFDAGIDGFVKQLDHAKFPFLTANYDFHDTLLEGRTQAYQIIEKGPFKIGLFGIGIELDGLVPENLYLETQYLDPIEIAQDQSKLLRKKGCDLIICLSHLGFKYQTDKVSDIDLATRVPEIDLILGGHTHTFLESAHTVSHDSGHPDTLISQAGWGGIKLGKVEYSKNRAGQTAAVVQSTLESIV